MWGVLVNMPLFDKYWFAVPRNFPWNMYEYALKPLAVIIDKSILCRVKNLYNKLFFK